MTHSSSDDSFVASFSPSSPGCSSPPHRAAASQKVRSYRVSEVRDLLDRTKVTVAGAAIVEVDHAEVVATANRRAVRRLRRAGFTVERMSSVRKKLRRAGGRAAAFPPADSNYHDYAEMAAEMARSGRRRTRRSSRARQHRARRSRGGRSGPLKVSDNVGTDENEPEVLFTANQHAREHLTVEMALYILKQLTDSRDRPARSRTSSTAARSGSSRWSTRTASSTTSPRAPTGCGARTARRNADRPQPQLVVPVGLLRRLVGHRQLGDLPRPVGLLGARDAAACATSSTRAWSAASSRSRRTSTGTPTPS